MDQLKAVRPTYWATNESLPAIVAGMNLQSGDRVLAIGGSGDQAFAMLEFADEVVVVDREQMQLELISMRKGLLADQNYEYFLDQRGLSTEMNREDQEKQSRKIDQRRAYFTQRANLDKIRAKLDKLVILPECSMDQAITAVPRVNKFYFSNIGIREDLSIFEVPASKPESLCYLTETYFWSDAPPGMQVEGILTLIARSEEEKKVREFPHWRPVVYVTPR